MKRVKGVVALLAFSYLVTAVAQADQWVPVPYDDQVVQAAAQFAVNAQSVATKEPLKLCGVQNAERQGAIYRIKVLVQGHKGASPAVATAVVLAKADGSYQLKQWRWNLNEN